VRTLMQLNHDMFHRDIPIDTHAKTLDNAVGLLSNLQHHHQEEPPLRHLVLHWDVVAVGENNTSESRRSPWLGECKRVIERKTSEMWLCGTNAKVVGAANRAKNETQTIE
jgi:hypothetical protein